MSSSKSEFSVPRTRWMVLFTRFMPALVAATVALAACQRRTSTVQKLPLAAQPDTSLASLRSNEHAGELKPLTRLAISDQCSKIGARSGPLDCIGASECQSFCEELATSLECHAQMTAVLGRFAEEGTESWECVAQGLPALREGHCSAEQAAYRSCRTASNPSSSDQP